jgi:hypothetical protein
VKPGQKLKNAIENLITLAKYALDNGVASDEQEKLAKKSIKKCEEFIRITSKDYEEILIGQISVDKFANLIKKNKK